MREHVKYGSNNSMFINLGGMYCQQMRPGTHRLGSKDSDLEVLRSPGNGDSPAVLRREAVGMFACRSQHHQNGQVILIKLLMLMPHDKLVLSNWSFGSLDIKLDGRPLQSFSFAGFRIWSW